MRYWGRIKLSEIIYLHFKKTIFIFGIGIPVNNKLNYAFWDILDYVLELTAKNGLSLDYIECTAFRCTNFIANIP